MYAGGGGRIIQVSSISGRVTFPMLGWYQADLDVAQRMHSLTTYLGHTHPVYTYWYLSATPELFALVGQRLERQLGNLS